MSRILGLVVCALLLGCLISDQGAQGNASDPCQVLFDNGDGELLWTSVEVEEGWSAFNLTLAGADALGLELGYSESDFGIFVYSIGNVGNAWPEEYWHFWIWDTDAQEWDYSMIGVGGVPVAGLEAIAWSYVMDRPDWSSERPLATPDYPYPWTMFRHDLNNGGGSEIRGPLTSEIRWEVELGNGAIDSAMAVGQGRIYVATAGLFNWSSLDHDSKPELFCLDTDGRVIWEAEYSNAGYQLSSPLLINDLLILSSTDGRVYAFYTGNGTQAWNFTTGFSYSGMTSSPVLCRNQILVGGGDGTLYALELNGTLVWSEHLASSIYFSSPAIREGIIYIGSDDGLLHAVAADGSGELWNVSAGGKVRSSPLVLEEMIVITYAVYDGFVAVDGGMEAFALDGALLWDLDLNASSASPVSTPEGIAVTSADGLSMVSLEGERLWALPTPEPTKGSPAVSGEALYLTTWGNQTRVMAVSFDGEILWQTILSLDSENQYSMCSPVLADSVLYVSADNGHVYAFDDVPPVASFLCDVDGLTIRLNASSSHDAQGELQYLWDLGDGNHSTGMIIEHAYSEAGNHTIMLTIIDDEGTEAQHSQIVQAVTLEAEGGLTWWQIIILLAVIVFIIGAMYMAFGRGKK